MDFLHKAILFLNSQNLQIIFMICSALGITSLLSKWRIEIRDSIEKLWIHLFHVRRVVAENDSLMIRTRSLEQKLKFVESSRDDFKGFVNDLSLRLDHLSIELDEAKKQLSHVKALLEDERNELEKIESERAEALVWGRQLYRQLKTLNIEPIASEPVYKTQNQFKDN